MPDALTLWSLAVLVIGGLMYAAMSMSTRSAPAQSSMAVRRPGWIARRRARGGIVHRRDRVGVGYKSAVGAVHLTLRELAGHGAAFGGPGSGKTTFLQLLVEAAAGQTPVVIVDPKGSPALAETVRGPRWTGLDTGRTSTRRSDGPATVAGARSAARGRGLQPRRARVPRCGPPTGPVGGVGARSAGQADGSGPTAAAARP